MCALLMAGTAFAEATRIRAVGASRYVEGEALVVLQGPDRTLAAQNVSSFRSALTRQADTLAASVGAKTAATYAAVAVASGRNIVFLRSSTRTTEQLLADLKANPAVLGAQPNYLARAFKTPNDPSYSQQWGLPKINAPTAWDTVTGPLAGADPVYVAVIDTGIDYNHPDLAGNMGRDKDNLYGKRFYNNGTVGTDPMDVDDHGSHVAGIIGAVGNNDTGVCGVNWAVKLLAVNVFSEFGPGDYRAYNTDTIAGIDYILAQKARGLNVRVANMSLGGWNTPPVGVDAYGTAIQAMSDAGILVAIAAGNEYQNIDSPGGPGSDPSDPTADYRGQRPYPACYRYTNTLTVGATDSGDVKSVFSNYSPNWVDLAAPGTGIYSTLPVSKGSYGNMSGTSMATPFVAGASALLMAAQPTRSTTEIRTMILTSGNTVGGTFWKNGRLDVANSMGATPPTPTGAGTATPTRAPSGGGGGGCSGLGFAPLAVLILLPLLALKRR
ncbi:S8 family peptidase [Aminomonas paucivorans]|uniref:S8 family peptidase n=1 Tax=Aminomonas paucivorans TaxID=81412 RepID=UPI0018DBC6F9|nr:S8 family peptidase [Aminomonas paucivorans]